MPVVATVAARTIVGRCGAVWFEIFYTVVYFLYPVQRTRTRTVTVRSGL